MSSHQELLVGLELPSQVGCVLDTGGRGGGMAGEGEDPGRRQPRFATHWVFFVVYSNNHRPCDRTEVSVLQIRHRGMDLCHLLKTVAGRL